MDNISRTNLLGEESGKDLPPKETLVHLVHSEQGIGSPHAQSADDLCAVAYLLSYGPEGEKAELERQIQSGGLQAATAYAKKRYLRRFSNGKELPSVIAYSGEGWEKKQTMRIYLNLAGQGVEAIRGDNLDDGLFVIDDDREASEIRIEELVEIGGYSVDPSPDDRDRRKVVIEGHHQTALMIEKLLSEAQKSGKTQLVLIIKEALAKQFTRTHKIRVERGETLSLTGYPIRKLETGRPNPNNHRVSQYRQEYPGYWALDTAPSLYVGDVDECLNVARSRVAHLDCATAS